MEPGEEFPDFTFHYTIRTTKLMPGPGNDFARFQTGGISFTTNAGGRLSLRLREVDDAPRLLHAEVAKGEQHLSKKWLSGYRIQSSVHHRVRRWTPGLSVGLRYLLGHVPAATQRTERTNRSSRGIGFRRVEVVSCNEQ